MLKKAVKIIFSFILFVLLFSALYLTLYNILARVYLPDDGLLPYTTIGDNLKYFLLNCLTISLLALCNLLVIFVLWNRPRFTGNMSRKVMLDFLVSFAVLVFINLISVGLAHTFDTKGKGVIWAGTILCNILMFLILELWYFIRYSQRGSTPVADPERESVPPEESHENEESTKRILVYKGGKYFHVNIQEIAYFHSEDKYTTLHTFSGDSHIIYQTLNSLQKSLDGEMFYRLSRNHLVHVDAIGDISKYHNGRLKVKLKIADSDDVIVSAARREDFMHWIKGSGR